MATFFKKHGILIGGIALLGLVAAAVFIWVIPNWSEITRIFSSRETLKGWINDLGFWGPVVFVLVTIAQVIVAPIPGNLVGIVGGTLFGVWWGFLLSYTGILIGSALAFYLGDRLGEPLVIKLVGKENYDKYTRIFRGNFSWALLVIFIVPIFPDDILCILAGISPLRFLRFMVIVAIGRAISVFTTNLVGAGLLEIPDLTIPWWGWMLAGIIVAGLTLLYFANRAKINQWLEKKIGVADEPEAGKDKLPAS